MDTFTSKDVILGKGNGVNILPGNVRFRELVAKYKQAYADAPRTKKGMVSKRVLAEIEESGGRFLERIEGGKFAPVDSRRAKEKTCQALRERPTARREDVKPRRCTKSTLLGKLVRERQQPQATAGEPRHAYDHPPRVVSCASSSASSSYSSSCSSSSVCSDEFISRSAKLGEGSIRARPPTSDGHTDVPGRYHSTTDDETARGKVRSCAALLGESDNNFDGVDEKPRSVWTVIGATAGTRYDSETTLTDAEDCDDDNGSEQEQWDHDERVRRDAASILASLYLSR